MSHYVMPFAYGVDDKGMPDTEAKARLDRALVIARSKLEYHDIIIFLGAGMPECTQRYGVESLAASMAQYLQEQGWPKHRIVQ